MRKLLCRIVLGFGAMLLSSFASAQVSTGLPPLGSFSSGPDVINLGNLNGNLRFPVVHKPGRGIPFDFILSYDTSVWTKVTANGATSWQPIGNFGWRTLTEANVGYISFRSTRVQCQLVIDTEPPTYKTVNEILRDQYQYHDMFGTIHNFANVTGGCPDDIQTNDTVSTDSSGYTLHTGGTLGGSITAPDGTTINPPVGTSTGGANRIDRNGNEITTNGSSFTDTLGATVLTSSGGVPNPLILTYTTSTGTQASVTVTYASYTVQTSFGCSGISEYGPTPTSLVSSISYPDGSSYSFTYEPTPGNSLNVTGRLNSITLRTGGKISYTYTGVNNGIICADGSTAGLTRTLTHDATTDSTTTYTRSNPSGSEWTTTVTDAASNQEVINFQASGTPVANFYETRRSIYQGLATGTPLLQIDTCYNSGTPDCSSTAVTLPITEIKRYATANGLKDSYTDTLLGSFGLPTRIDQYDYRSSPAVLQRRTLIAYAPLGNGIAGMPSSITVQDGASHQIAQTTFNYDESAATPTSGVPQHVAISGSRGNLTSISRWLNTTNTSLVTSMTYDDTGNMLSSTDPGGHKTQFSYTDNFTDGINHGSLAYLTGVTMPDTNSPNLAHHQIFTEYDFHAGLVMARTDQNLNSTLYTYDSMLRPLNINFPDGGQTSVSYPNATQTVVQRKIDGARSTFATTIFDSFGRVSRTASGNGETSSPYDLQDFCYDLNGRLQYRSYPYQAGDYAGANDCSHAGDTFTYDSMGRTAQITHSDGSSSQVTYSGRAQEFTDEGNGTSRVSRIQQTDALGRLASLCELYAGPALLGNNGTPADCGLDLTGSGFLTSYSYDLLDNLTSIAQGGLPQRTFGYDSLSRLTSESHPEWTALTSSTPATVTYAYNADGLLSTRVRPAPNQTSGAVTVTTNYGYDELHRLRSRSYTNDPSGTPTATYNYDLPASGGVTLANTNGRLATASNGGAAGELLSYDAMGRVIKNWQCTPNAMPCNTGSYLLTYGYDLAGDRISFNNGAGETFSYAYNTAPHLTTVTSSLSDANHPGTLLSNVHYGVYGVSGDTLGNNVVELFGFNNYGELSAYSATTLGGLPIYSFSVTSFAPNWNVTSVADTANANWTFGYDQLNRLASASLNSGAQTFTYEYDRYGNRWHQNAPQGGPAPQYVFDTNNHITTTGVTYDAVGNMSTDGLGNTFTYDAESRLVQVSNNNGTYSYFYDPEGRRAHTSSFDFIYDVDGRVASILAFTGGAIYDEIYAGGRHLATYFANTTNFLHTDWLGTKRLMTNVTGAVSETCSSMPFGDALACTGSEMNFLHFTDDVHDSEDNLEHTWFRQYSTTQGRFASTDPYPGSMDLGNPQTLNRYAYANNDPVDLVDPLGLNPGDPGGGPFANNCTLVDGGPDEVFACPDLFGHASISGGGFSFGLFGPGFGGGFGGLGGGFGGVPLPGCFLPGACNVQLPSLSQQINQWLSGVLPNAGCNSGPVIYESCNPASTNSFVSAPPIPWQTIGIAAEQGLLKFLGVLGGVLFLTGDNVPHQTSNTAQNKQFNDAVKEIERRCGFSLTPDQRRQLHDAISGQGYDYHGIISEGVGMFCPGK